MAVFKRSFNFDDVVCSRTLLQRSRRFRKPREVQGSERGGYLFFFRFEICITSGIRASRLRVPVVRPWKLLQQAMESRSNRSWGQTPESMYCSNSIHHLSLQSQSCLYKFLAVGSHLIRILSLRGPNWQVQCRSTEMLRIALMIGMIARRMMMM